MTDRFEQHPPSCEPPANRDRGFSGPLLAVLALVALLTPRPLSAEPTVAIEATPREVLVGQPIDATVRIRWTPPERVHPLDLAEDLGSFVVKHSNTDIDRELKGGAMERTVHLTLTTFEIGEREIPPLEIAWDSPAGEIATLETDPVTITVRSYLENLAQTPVADADGATSPGAAAMQLRPIRPPISWPGLPPALLTAVAVCIALLAISGTVWLLLKRRRRNRAHSAHAPAPLLPPDEEALRALARIETERLAERAPAKAYYTELNEVLRRYMGRRYGFDALEMTSSQVLDRAGRLAWPEHIYHSLVTDAAETDSVKFARYTPSRTQRLEALERVRRIVLETRPTPPPETAASDRSEVRAETVGVH